VSGIQLEGAAKPELGVATTKASSRFPEVVADGQVARIEEA
jgi:hypothetical protein